VFHSCDALFNSLISHLFFIFSTPTRRAASTITKLTATSQYRPDLTKFAIARYHALKRSLTTDGSISKDRKRTKRAAGQ
jgi:hypothetical protein